MRFRVFRTSDFGPSEHPPIEGATPNLEQVRQWWGDRAEYIWYIEVPDLDALLTLIRQTPKCRIVLDSEPCIEVYDDYRE